MQAVGQNKGLGGGLLAGHGGGLIGGQGAGLKVEPSRLVNGPVVLNNGPLGGGEANQGQDDSDDSDKTGEKDSVG